MKEVNEYQADLLADIMNFFFLKKKTKPKSPEKNQEKKIVLIFLRV